ncbi:ATP-binding protein, partial [Streptococcus pneumoniae]
MEELEKIYSMEKMQDSKDNILEFAKHNLYSNIGIKCDGDKLFSKHLAIVGSTGSGKSCAVATVIQTLNVEIEKKNNTHVLIFDIHGEYKKAFPNSNHLALQDNSLKIPYWLMTSDELEDLFIESSDLNAYNQISQFKFAVTQNKIPYNSEL